jgi:hypothetical protein
MADRVRLQRATRKDGPVPVEMADCALPIGRERFDGDEEVLVFAVFSAPSATLLDDSDVLADYIKRTARDKGPMTFGTARTLAEIAYQACFAEAGGDAGIARLRMQGLALELEAEYGAPDSADGDDTAGDYN